MTSEEQRETLNTVVGGGGNLTLNWAAICVFIQQEVRALGIMHLRLDGKDKQAAKLLSLSSQRDGEMAH